MCWYYSQRVARRHLVNTPLACCASMRPRRRDHKQRKIVVRKLVIAGQEDPCSDLKWITPSRSCPARPVPWGDAQATSVLESFGCTFERISGPTPRGQLSPPSAPQQDLSSTLEKFSKICLPLTLDIPCSLLVLFCARRLFYANRHPQGAPDVEQPPRSYVFQD